ncbi:hypothetical protein K7I13_10750 [Brucepastera parasyntrophica]|uniref:hypothetical protein n=1 Tax=Brucepastera parasyntrophica TaxID=2880008 RepID=UPI00210CE17B|nr:hypothetical protein [Brucepastera parasyntrophica]ULQ58991.1 hypothetical protein K7I13_10750 [Brucepastera parasyntrophica]
MTLLEEAGIQLGFKAVNNIYRGRYNGYWFSLENADEPGSSEIIVSMLIDKSVSEEKMKSDLLQIESVYNAEMEDTMLQTYINTAGMPYGTFIETLNAILSVYREYGVKPECALCGQNEPDGFYKLNEKIIPVCPSCAGNINSLKEETKAGSLKSYILGGIGALAGALVGSIVWIVIGAIGFYASIGGVAIAYAAFYGYRTLGGKTTKLSAVIIAVCVLIAVFFAELFGIGLEIVSYARSEGWRPGLTDIIYIIFGFITGENAAQVYLDMLVGLLFAGLGSYRLLKNIFSNRSRERSVLKNCKNQDSCTLQ